MSAFDDEVLIGSLEMLREAGDPAQCSLASLAAPLATTAILDRDVERTVGGMQSTYMERRTEMTLPSRGVVGITQGDTVTLKGETWRWVSKVSDDGYLITGIVKPERI